MPIGELMFASLAALAAIGAFAATSGHSRRDPRRRTCRFENAEHRLTVTSSNDDANGGIVRDGDASSSRTSGRWAAPALADPTRFNTERVRVRARARAWTTSTSTLEPGGWVVRAGLQR